MFFRFKLEFPTHTYIIFTYMYIQLTNISHDFENKINYIKSLCFAI